MDIRVCRLCISKIHRLTLLSRFTGSSGTAVISATEAYLFTDSRYYIQAARELDGNWTLVKVGWQGAVNWDEWLIVCLDLMPHLTLCTNASTNISFEQGESRSGLILV